MADIRINALATTAASTASDDYIAIDGSANGTRKLSAYSPTFGGNLTVSGTVTSNSSFLVDTNTSFVAHTTTAAKVQAQTSWGGVLSGFGTTNDVSIFNKSGGLALSVPTGTTNVGISGNLTVSGGTVTSGTGTLTLNSSANTVVLQSAGTTALTLDSSQNATFAGQVNSGTSSSSGYNNNRNIQLEAASARVIVNHENGFSSGTIYVGFGYNGTGIGSITQDGTTGVLYNTTSDARLKTNIRDVTNSGSIIDALKPRVFDWKDYDDKDRFGFLAQEVYAVFPQAVKKGDDGEGVTDAWAMDAAKLVPVLVAEIKALRVRVAGLENQ